MTSQNNRLVGVNGEIIPTTKSKYIGDTEVDIIIGNLTSQTKTKINKEFLKTLRTFLNSIANRQVIVPHKIYYDEDEEDPDINCIRIVWHDNVLTKQLLSSTTENNSDPEFTNTKEILCIDIYENYIELMWLPRDIVIIVKQYGIEDIQSLIEDFLIEAQLIE